MKNWLRFVFGPLFAIESIPRAVCCSHRRGKEATLVRTLAQVNREKAPATSDQRRRGVPSACP